MSPSVNPAPQPSAGLFIHAPDTWPQRARPVPLVGVRAEATMRGAAAEVVLSQRFKNVESTPIEAVYLFPLPTEAAICGLSAEVDGRLVEGRVEERERAFEIYDDALADGHGAFLLDQERPNVFTLSVGNLRPGAEATIRLRWVQPVAREGDALRFTLPTTVSPRYHPAPGAPEIGQPDHDKLDPERRHHVPYGLAFELSVEGFAGGIKRVESPSHPIRATLAPAVAVELAQEEVALDRDLVVIVEPAALATPSALVARDAAGARYVQIGFRPEIEASAEGAEVIFVLDCSGSMAGDSITSARRALELCVRALDLQDAFDIVRFGSTHDALFGQARRFDEASLAAAVAFVHATDATMGGTEILAPLDAIVRRPLAPRRTRQVMLLTDGQVSNESDVIALAARHAATTRIFSFGIGAGVSEHLVREVARASRGEVEMIAPGERIEPKVLRQFGRVRSPALTDVQVDWGGLEVEQAPRAVPPVFKGELLTVWAKVLGGTASEVTLRAGERRWSVPLDLERAEAGGPVPLLWGRAAIRDLEAADGRHGSAQERPGARERRKNERLVAIGQALGLVSSATSYVAVELRAEGERTHGAELRRVPIALTAGWGGGAAAGPQAVMRKSRARFAAAPMAPPAPPAPAGAPARRAGGLFAKMASALSGGSVGRSAAPEAAAGLFDAMPLEQAIAPAPPASAASADALYDLLLTQRADGSFPPSPALTALIADPAALARLGATHGEAVVLTALVLALLERDFADRQAEWQAAADKARRFLAPSPALDPGALLGALVAGRA